MSSTSWSLLTDTYLPSLPQKCPWHSSKQKNSTTRTTILPNNWTLPNFQSCPWRSIFRKIRSAQHPLSKKRRQDALARRQNVSKCIVSVLPQERCAHRSAIARDARTAKVINSRLNVLTMQWNQRRQQSHHLWKGATVVKVTVRKNTANVSTQVSNAVRTVNALIARTSTVSTKVVKQNQRNQYW